MCIFEQLSNFSPYRLLLVEGKSIYIYIYPLKEVTESSRMISKTVNDLCRSSTKLVLTLYLITAGPNDVF